MLQHSGGETEIVLGNKRLLGIFFVVVLLLGIAFAGGYKVGQGSKKAGVVAAVDGSSVAATGANGGETHALTGDSSSGGSTEAPASTSSNPDAPPAPDSTPAPNSEPVPQEAPPLGSPTRPKSSEAAPRTPRPKSSEEESPSAAASFTPQSGQTFLQVAAVSRDEALAVADVLRKKGFRAHAVPRPGGGKLYRVIIGPTRDARDLNNTRGALRNAGFQEIFVQHY